jgi:hypothetical protein
MFDAGTRIGSHGRTELAECPNDYLKTAYDLDEGEADEE